MLALRARRCVLRHWADLRAGSSLPSRASALAALGAQCQPSSIHQFSISRAFGSGGARIRRHPLPGAGGTEDRASDLELLPPAVREALEVVMGFSAPLEARLGAVRALGDMAAPPFRTAAAEDALHHVLCEAQGDNGQSLREAAEEALWNAWHSSGQEKVDQALQQGMRQMEKGDLGGAVLTFTKVIDMAPEFTEGWNKRATAHFLLKNLDKSLADGIKTLALKPRHFGCLSGLGMVQQAKGNNQEAVKWFKAALNVHPHIEGARRICERLELQTSVNQQLRPQIVRVARSLDERSGSRPSSPEETPTVPAPAPAEGLSCDWDVHRVPATTNDGECTYFFRVRLRNEEEAPSPVRSLARFYALRFAGGRIFPLTRVTEGPAAFMLEPTEEHRFCWHMSFRQELEDTAGGMLLERVGQAYEGDTRFVHTPLERRVPAEASLDEVERLKLGYVYTGQLNLNELSLGKPPI
ncbi:unnamed protein product [Polarella glacialis]|uniref:Uncharacterized protein n=1 Tax=Polarella glacialis TaxID=89957 RepID=A0A813HBY0_POLGL|nr:unnamed protein product [Polarella glacialis]CAE8716740.1 unnamed protein product [Polarella glacialis]